MGGIWGTGGEPEGTKVFLPGFRTLKVLTAEESSGGDPFFVDIG